MTRCGGPKAIVIKVVLQESPKSPDIHDLSECHRIYDFGKASPGCQESSPSYQVTSLNFDFKKVSMRSVQDHLKNPKYVKRSLNSYSIVI